MYDKKKTLSSYMGGGYMNPMGYATGGYIPGLSRSRFTLGLQRDSRIAQEEFEEQAKKLEKEQYWRGIGKTLGKVGGTALGALLAAPTGGLSIAAGKALGATLGTAAGGAIGGSGQDASNIKDSSTGLYKDDFEYLREQGRKAESFKRLGQESAIAGGTTYLGAKSGDIVSGGKKFIGDKFGVESLENLGLAGKTEPLFSSLNQDVAKAKAGAKFVIGDLDMQRLPLDFASTKDYDAELAMLFDEIAGQEQAGQNIVGGGVLNFNKGGMFQQYQNGGEAKDSKKEYFDREFPKDSFKAMIQEAVYKGEIDPREGLQYILNKQQKDFLESKGDTSSALYNMLKKSGYNQGGMYNGYKDSGLIDMKQFGRRIL